MCKKIFSAIFRRNTKRIFERLSMHGITIWPQYRTSYQFSKHSDVYFCFYVQVWKFWFSRFFRKLENEFSKGFRGTWSSYHYKLWLHGSFSTGLMFFYVVLFQFRNLCFSIFYTDSGWTPCKLFGHIVCRHWLEEACCAMLAVKEFPSLRFHKCCFSHCTLHPINCSPLLLDFHLWKEHEKKNNFWIILCLISAAEVEYISSRTTNPLTQWIDVEFQHLTDHEILTCISRQTLVALMNSAVRRCRWWSYEHSSLIYLTFVSQKSFVQWWVIVERILWVTYCCWFTSFVFLLALA